MAEQLVLDLIIQDEGASKSIGAMRKEIKEMQSQMMHLDPNSKGFEEAALRAAELKDQIADTTEQMQHMQGAGSLEGFNAGLGNAKMQLKNLDFDGVARQISGMGMSLKQINLSTFADGLGKVGGSLLQLGKTILMSPLFWFAAVIAGIVLVFTQFEDAILGADKTLGAVGEEIKNVSAKYGELNQKISKYKTVLSNVNTTEAQRIKTLGEYNTLAKENNLFLIDINSSLEKQNDILVLNDSLIRDRMKLEAIQNVQKEKYAQLIEAEIMLEEIKEGIKQSSSKQETQAFNVLMAQQQEKISSLNDEINKLDDLTDEYDDLSESQKKISTFEEKRIENSAKIAENQAILTAQAEAEAQAAIRAGEEWVRAMQSANDYFDKILYNSLTEREKLREDFETDADEFQEFLDKKMWSQEQYDTAMLIREQEYKDELNKINEDNLQKRKDIATKFFEENAAADSERKEEEKKDANLQYDRVQTFLTWDTDFKKRRKENEEDVTKKKQEEAEKQLNNFQNLNAGIASIGSSTLGFLENLASGNEKKRKKVQKAQFNLTKASSAVETSISTIKAIVEESGNIPMQIFIGLQGAAAVASILSKKFPETGSESSGGGSGSEISSMQPSLSTLNSTGGGTPTSFTPFGNNSITPQPQRVYVLESDITTTQNNVNKINVQQSL